MITEKQGQVLAVLWSGEDFSLGEVTKQLKEITNWSKTTVHTYLTRMEKQGLVEILREKEPHRYKANISREECSKDQRKTLLQTIYQGAMGDLISAFLKESPITAEEKKQLQQLLEEMEDDSHD